MNANSATAEAVNQNGSQDTAPKQLGLFGRARARYRKSPLVRALVKSGVALIALLVAASTMSGIHWGGIAGAMLAISPWALGLAVLTALLQSALLVTRFWAIFPKKKRPSWGTAARAYAYSQSANVYLPGRAGEVLRVLTLTRETNEADGQPRTSVADATSATILDRVLDVLAFVAMALLFGKSLLAGALLAALSWGWVLLAGLGVLAVVALLVRRFAPDFFRKAKGAVREARTAARNLVTVPRFAGGIGLGLLSWVAELGTMLLLGWGLGLHVGALQMIVGLIVLNLGIAIPVTFANIGAYEAATVIGLAPFGVSVTDAIALGAIHHGIQLVAVFGPALFLWVRDRLARRAECRNRRALEDAPTGRAVLPPVSAHGLCPAWDRSFRRLGRIVRFRPTSSPSPVAIKL